MCILLCNYLLLMIIIIITSTCAMSLLLGCYVLCNHSYCDVIHFFLYNCMLLSSPRLHFTLPLSVHALLSLL